MRGERRKRGERAVDRRGESGKGGAKLGDRPPRPLLALIGKGRGCGTLCFIMFYYGFLGFLMFCHVFVWFLMFMYGVLLFFVFCYVFLWLIVFSYSLF